MSKYAKIKGLDKYFLYENALNSLNYHIKNAKNKTIDEAVLFLIKGQSWGWYIKKFFKYQRKKNKNFCINL